jgi:hypothetical protein
MLFYVQGMKTAKKTAKLLTYINYEISGYEIINTTIQKLVHPISVFFGF